MDENNDQIDVTKILNEEEEPEQVTAEVPEAPEGEEVIPEYVEPGQEGEPERPGEPAVPAFAEPVPEKAKRPKKSRKTMLIAGIAAVIVVVLVIIIASAAKSPLAMVVKGFENTAESMKKNGIVALLNDVADGGSVEVACDLENLTEYMVGFAVEGDASVKLYSSDSKAALVAGVKMNGSSVLDAALIAGKDEIAVSSETLFGSKSYGVSLKNFAKNFENSAFGPDGEYSLGVSLEEIEEYLDSIKNSEKNSKEAVKVLGDMADTLVKSVKANAKVEKSKVALDFGGEEVKTTAVKVSMDGVALINIMDDLIEYMRTDKNFKAFMAENIEYSATVTGAYYSLGDSEEMLEEFYTVLDEAAEELEDAAGYMEDADVEVGVTFYVTTSGSLLVGVDVDADIEGDTFQASLYAGPSFEKLGEISFRYDDGGTNLRGTYTVSERSKNAYIAKLRVRENSVTALSGEINWDKKSGDFTVEMSDGRDTYGLEGSLEQSGKTTTVSIDSFNSGGWNVDLGIDLILKTSDKMPSTPKYTDILTMNATDLEELIYDLSDVISGLSYLY